MTSATADELDRSLAGGFARDAGWRSIRQTRPTSDGGTSIAARVGTGDDFDEVFARLRSILEPYGRRMHLVADEPNGYSVDMAPPEDRNPTTWFAAVRRGKAYVSIYLMPIYVDPELAATVSPQLQKRKQGKSCFNFRSVDDVLFAELEDLTRRGFERTAGNPAWGVAKRQEHGMARRKAMDATPS